MQQRKPVPILVRLPPALLRKIERSATEGHRSRNAEAVRRLEESFKKVKTEVPA